MRKEVLFAIFFGLFIGLIFAFGIFRVNSAMKSKDSVANPDTNNADTSSSKTNDQKTLTLLNPADNSAVASDIIQVSGITHAQSYIVTTGGTSDTVQKSKIDGSFEFDYEIDPSVNYLNITSVTADNQRVSTSLEVAYSSEIANPNKDQEVNDTKDSADQKLEATQNRIEFFQGTVTDLTESGVQLKDKNGDIEQVSYSVASTSFAKFGVKTSKISAVDIAIGDFILAMGHIKANSLLEAVRIVVTQPQTPLEVKIFYGTVIEKNKADFGIDEKDSGKVSLNINNNTNTYTGDVSVPTKSRYTNVSEGDTVIGTYTTEKDVNSARKIYILPSPTPTPES